MATRDTTPTSIDVQNLVNGALKLEVKLLNAGVDALRVYLNQAARFSNLASETLQAVQDDKATLAGTAKKLTDFGRQNVQTFAELSQRLGASYYDELDRLAGGVLTSDTAQAAAAAVRPSTQAVRPQIGTVRPAAKRARAARGKGAKRARTAKGKAAKGA
jgi:hypothetical protein